MPHLVLVKETHIDGEMRSPGHVVALEHVETLRSNPHLATNFVMVPDGEHMREHQGGPGFKLDDKPTPEKKSAKTTIVSAPEADAAKSAD